MAIFALYPQAGFRASPHAHDERPASLYYALSSCSRCLQRPLLRQK